MLARFGLANRVLNVAIAGGAQQVLRSLAVSDPLALTRPPSSTRAHSSKHDPEPTKETTDSTGTWPEIKEHVQALRASGSRRQELTDSAPAALMNAFLSAGNWLESTLTAMLHFRIDRDFDLTEFQAGAKHAFHMVNGLLGSNDMHHLKPMLSPRLHEMLSDMRKAYKQEGCIVSVEVDDIKEQSLVQVETYGEEHMARFGVEQPASDAAADNLPSSKDDEPNQSSAANGEGSFQASNAYGLGGIGGFREAAEHLDKLAKIPKWLAVTVRYQGRVITKVTDENGQVLSEDDDRRSQYWQFARGPLPPLPAQSVESPWFLLSMQ